MKTKYNPATARSYYLNAHGTRAVSIDRDGNRETLPVSIDGETVKPRAVTYWEQCGNFAFPAVRIKGKAVTVYPDDETEPTKWQPYEIHKAQREARYEAYEANFKARTATAHRI